MPKYDLIMSVLEIWASSQDIQTNINKLFPFFSPNVRMSGKNIIFDDEKIKLFNIYDIDVNNILVSEKEAYGKKIHLNTTLDMIIVTTLDHYK